MDDQDAQYQIIHNDTIPEAQDEEATAIMSATPNQILTDFYVNNEDQENQNNIVVSDKLDEKIRLQ